MLRLFIKDNTTGHIHEYGMDKHDSLILQEDGSLHYEHMQGCVGTKYPEEGFSFCLEDGTIPEWDLEHGVEPYIDIAGEYCTKPKTNADRIRAMSDVELEQFINHFNICDSRTNEECKMSYCACCEVCVMDWLQQPAEDTTNKNISNPKSGDAHKN